MRIQKNISITNIIPMKKLFYFLSLSFLIISCGGGSEQTVEDLIASDDIKAIKERKQNLTEEQRLLNNQIALLDSVISAKDGNEKLPLVSTLTAEAQKFDHFLELQGDVMTKQNVLIYPEMSGTLLRVYAKEGQKVSKGQTLAKIDDGGMGSQLEQLKTQASLAKTTFERQQRLWDQKIGSEIQYLQAKASYEASENMVMQAQSQLGKSVIRAPFSGIIDDVIKDQGTVVAPGPGSEVFRIVNLSNMYVSVDVPEGYLGGIQKGKEAKVYFPVLGDTITSSIRQTGNFINPSNRAFTIEIPIPNKKGNIKPNLSARVSLNDYTNEEAILIPQGIISENSQGEQYVYVIETTEKGKATAKRRIIETGKTQGSVVEVLSGIQVGENLIKEGARNVKEGQNVQILNEEADE